MAACDKFTINVKGKGGHGAAPQGTVDAIVEAAAVVTALQTVVSRNMVRYITKNSTVSVIYIYVAMAVSVVVSVRFVHIVCFCCLLLQDPLESSVITCGTIKGGYAANIVADNVQIVGTTRSFTRSAQQLIKARMQCVCCGVAQTYGGEVDILYEG
jgi:metal-dependent amidase/aminoacylase/carboxypeptidase family protein